MESTKNPDICDSTVPCPVCGQKVAYKAINDHVDTCLNLQKCSSPTTAVNACAKLKQVLLTPPARKQSVLNRFEERKSPPSSRETEKYMPSKKRKVSNVSTDNLDTPGFPQVPFSTKNSGTPSHAASKSPLADFMRPASIADYVGQDHIMGPNSILHSVVESGHIPSLVLWGPPGCGKTTLALILARAAREKAGARFVQLSATVDGVKEIKEVVKVSRNDKAVLKRQTILFIDEIHQFNKRQQDVFLPHVEDGTITLIGATTENPSFKLNSALLSRCHVLVLHKLDSGHVESILKRAMGRLCAIEEEEYEERGRNGDPVKEKLVIVDKDVVPMLSSFCDGDARNALNALQIAVEAVQSKHQSSQRNGGDQPASDLDEGVSQTSALPRVTVSDAKESLQRSHLLYDRAGEEHYNCISALHKSMRGSHASASLYWLARMLSAGEDPLYVARRIIRCASEDIGMADPSALTQAVSAYQACHLMGMPECDVVLAQAVVYMARAPKSVEVYSAYRRATQCVRHHPGPLPGVPLHLRNAPTRLMKDLGYGEGYMYNPHFSGAVEQKYLPEELEGTDFFVE